MDAIHQFQRDIQDEDDDKHILMVDYIASAEAMEGLSEAEESSRREGETCFGTVIILH